ncbi:MAG: hypothetical protein WCI89_01300 [bacterium]
MNVKVIFNTNKKLKEAAMKKARKEGLTYSAVLNIATEAYVGDRLKITALEQHLEKAREEIRQGRYYTHEQVMRKLGLSSKK